jgi:hypothetical protein
MILGIANIVVVVGLVIITYLYMRHTKRLANDTKRMADMMVREFELRIAPFIVIDQLSSARGKNSKQYDPIISNKGSLLVPIKKIVQEWWYKESPGKTYRKETVIDKTLGKGESTRYQEYVIMLNKGDMVTDDFEQSKDLDFIQLLPLA